MRSFRCSVTILITIDHLGKFDGKADEDFFVGYYLNSKAFRVFNSRTRIVEENLHIRFSESTSNVHSLMVLQTADLPFSQYPKSSNDDGSKPLSDDRKKVNEDTRKENECNNQEKEDNVNSTNNLKTVSSTVDVGGTNEDNELQFDPNMPAFEDVRTFDFSSDDEDDAVVADMNNLDTTIQKELCNAFENLVNAKFQMSSMGELTFFLGLQVKQKKDGTFISQDKYVTEILKKFGFTEVKTASTPMETQKPLLKDEDGEEVDVHMCRYLNGQLKLGLWYLKDSSFDLVAYTDSDYARAILDRKSTIGGCQFLRCRLISWQCKNKQWLQILQHKLNMWLLQVPQPSGPTDNVADEAVHKELGDSLVKVTRNHRDTIAQTRFVNVSKHSNDSLLVRGNTLQSDENSIKLDELMELCTTLQDRVLDLEKIKTTQRNEIDSLKREVKKLKKRNSLGEDASKQGRRIDADEDITMANDANNEMFDVDNLGGEEVFVTGKNDNVVKEVINTAQVSTAATTVIITTEEITLAQALESLKNSKPKVKGIFFKSQPKKKDQIRLDKEERLQERERELKKNKKPILP
nr:ribonuclease H-like domain-containing protein [Tanacetum cinerariifolium]